MLQKDPAKRLGCGPGGANEVKAHSLFKAIDWKRLEAGMVKPPFEPDVRFKSYLVDFSDSALKASQMHQRVRWWSSSRTLGIKPDGRGFESDPLTAAQ